MQEASERSRGKLEIRGRHESEVHDFSATNQLLFICFRGLLEAECTTLTNKEKDYGIVCCTLYVYVIFT